jgi:hypothetical protein
LPASIVTDKLPRLGKEVAAMTGEKSCDKAVGGPQESHLITIFVYGSLMRGEHNHKLLAGSAFLGEALTADQVQGARLMANGDWRKRTANIFGV